MNITLINSSSTSGIANDVQIYCSAKTNVDYSVPAGERIVDGVDYTHKKTATFIPYYSEYSEDPDPNTGEIIRTKTKQGVVDIEEGKQLYSVTIKIYDDSDVLQIEDDGYVYIVEWFRGGRIGKDGKFEVLVHLRKFDKDGNYIHTEECYFSNPDK